jgi:hypothetical protein
MKTIWKYKLELTDVQNILMPESARILSVQFQRRELCLWALLDPEEPKMRRRIRIVGTGNPMPDHGSIWWFIGTVQQEEYGLVWHVFAEQARPLVVDVTTLSDTAPRTIIVKGAPA